MKTPNLTLSALILGLLSSPAFAAEALPSAITYQGKLSDGLQPANGTYDLKFTLHDSTDGGSPVGPAITNNAAGVSNGLFTAALDFGSASYNGSARWLEISVRKTGSGLDFARLSPRQPLTPAPYAMYAPSANVAAVATTVAPGSITTTSLAAGAVTVSDIANGTVVRSVNGQTDAVTISTNFWSVGGNAGIGTGAFLGTTDNTPVKIAANNVPGLRLEPVVIDASISPGVNIIGGSPVNFMTSEAYASVIAGGGCANAYGESYTNMVAARFAFLGGGSANSIESHSSSGVIDGGSYNTLQYGASASAIGGGAYNTIGSNSTYSVIAGGTANTNSGSYSGTLGGLKNRAGSYAAVAGGSYNVAVGNGAFIGGGTATMVATNNYASGISSAVLGGSLNSAIGRYSAVLGGQNNMAVDYATAAGRRAKANHWGSFVWADSTDADFASSANNQFLIRASGNVGINTTTPQSALDVAGTVTATGFSGSGAGLTGIGASGITDGSISSAELSNDADSLSRVSGGQLSAVSGQLVASANLFLGNQDLLLRGYDDRDHGLGYFGQAGINKSFGGVNVDGPVLYGYSGGALGIKQASGNKSNVVVYWNAAGRVGIGNTSPATALDVAGTITASGMNGSGVGPLEFRVNGQRALQISPGVDGVTSAPNMVVGPGSSTLSPGTAITGGTGHGIDSSSAFSVIAGGKDHHVGKDARYASIGGGYNHDVGTNSYYTTIAGGQQSAIAVGANHSTIAGGKWNTIGNISSSSTIGGGLQNVIGTNSSSSVIGGGASNIILSNAQHTVIAGGQDNQVSGYLGAIGGGAHNRVSGPGASIPGGNSNQAKGVNSFAAGTGAQALGDGSFVLTDASSYAGFGTTVQNQFRSRFTGGYELYTTATGGVKLAPGSGSWIDLSDRNAKENFEPVDQHAVLERVAALPMSTWNYKSQDASIRHIGVMAQDFKAAFGLGETDTGIATVDADGVALAAIQGLNQKVDSRIARLEAENSALAQEVAELKALVNMLAAKLNIGAR